jgi:hypothetical protein
VYLLQEPGAAGVLLAHLDPQSALFRGWVFSNPKKKKVIGGKIFNAKTLGTLSGVKMC